MRVVLAAGNAVRFGGKPKYELEVEGEPLRDRIERQFGLPQVWMIHCQTSCTCETLQASRKWWWPESVTVLYGDAYYTDDCVRRIKDVEEHGGDEIRFFSDRQDLFAIYIPAAWYERVEAALDAAIEAKHNDGRVWEMYRHLLGLPLTAGLPDRDRYLVLVADRTQDFDSPEEYEAFLAGTSKNRLLTKGE